MKINSQLDTIKENYSFHFGIELSNENLAKFSGITHVIMQGSTNRAKVLAKKLAHEVLNIDSNFFDPINIINSADFAIYRIGKILSISHGMGNTTMDTVLHALTKILHYAGNNKVEYIRVGTSGGIGIKPGTVVITKQAFMPDLSPYYATNELDKQVNIPTQFNQKLVNKIYSAQPDNLSFDIIIGNSIAADDFYLGQCRYDGAMQSRQDEEWRKEFFNNIRDLDIYNFEMESSALAAFCHQAEIPATMIAVTLLNRLESDQVTSSAEKLAEFSDHSHLVIINYIKSII
ncbi:MAG: hypothetical protein PHC75_02635 [Burkholderiales bacterium]|nr:hypothetical protein [Burkholderiales bacterium]